jgi:hypothetical protein
VNDDEHGGREVGGQPRDHTLHRVDPSGRAAHDDDVVTFHAIALQIACVAAECRAMGKNAHTSMRPEISVGPERGTDERAGLMDNTRKALFSYWLSAYRRLNAPSAAKQFRRQLEISA